MTDLRTIAAYDEKAVEYEERFTTEKENPYLAAFIAEVAPGAHVLDLGCGPGHAAQRMSEAGLIVTGTDASREMIARAQSRGFGTFSVATFNDLVEIAAYDGVWANFSLLHAPREDLPRHLAAIRASLRVDGVLHIGMKTGSGMARDSLDRQYTYYQEDELSDRIHEAGFKILKSDTGATVGLDGTLAPWVINLARVSYDD